MCKKILTGLALGMFIGCGAAVAAPITINLIDGDWSNATPEGMVVANSGDEGGLSTVRWGRPANQAQGQSGYDFQSLTTPLTVQSDGAVFALGSFTHHNFPIYPPSLETIDLTVRLGGVEMSALMSAVFNITHDETTNSASPQSNPLNNDLVTITNPIVNQTFIYDNVQYYFNLIGFSQNGGETITSSFSTIEGQANTATLYGRITSEALPQVPEPVSALLFGAGLVGLAALGRRKQQA